MRTCWKGWWINQNNRSGACISKLALLFLYVSRAVTNCIVRDHSGFRKVCAHWVLYVLLECHKEMRVGSALEFQMHYRETGDGFHNSIFTSNEMWISSYTPESKRQLCEWCHPKSSMKPTMITSMPFERKLMATVFWDQFGMLLIDFTPRGITLMQNVTVKLRKLQHPIKNQCCG